MEKPQVVVITWCKDIDALYGTTLTFKTLRTGYPTSDILVIENASVPEAREEIKAHAKAVDAEFLQLETEWSHHAIIEHIALQSTRRKLVFCDPDLVFWGNVENWQFPSKTLAAGRLIPDFLCPYTRTVTMGRLHTSHLIFPDLEKLRTVLLSPALPKVVFRPFQPVIICDDNRWRRFDTAAVLFQLLKPAGLACEFTESQLDTYDHLFCGTHFSSVSPHLPPEVKTQWQNLHDGVRHGRIHEMRGIWRTQENEFAKLSHLVQSSHTEGAAIWPALAVGQ